MRSYRWSSGEALNQLVRNGAVVHGVVIALWCLVCSHHMSYAHGATLARHLQDVAIHAADPDLSQVRTHPDKSVQRVLIIHSYHQGLSWTDSLHAAIVESLRAGSDVEVYVEYLDAKRNGTKLLAQHFESFIATKYAENQPEVIIACDNIAFEATQQYHATLFPDVPIVFCGINSFTRDMVRRPHLTTGVVDATDIRQTLDFIQHLHPKLERCIVIGDQTETGRAEMARARRALGATCNNVEISYLQEDSLDGICMQLGRLDPDRDAVILTVFNRSPDGTFYTYEQSAAAMVAASDAPIFGLWDFYIGTGVVGGHMTSAVNQGHDAGDKAIRVIRGDLITSIPIQTMSPNQLMFDARAARRYGLEAKDCPPGTHVVNTKQSVWEQYGRILSVGIAIIVGETAIILCVIWMLQASRRRYVRTRLKQAEKLEANQEKLRQREQRLSLALSAAGAGTWEWNLQTDQRNWDEKQEQIYGMDPGSFDGSYEQWARYLMPDDLHRVSGALREALDGGTPYNVEFRITVSDDNVRTLHAQGVVENDDDGRPMRMIGVTVDVTEQTETRRLHAKLMAAIEAAHESVVITDRNGKIEYVNEAFVNTTGYRREEVFGLNPVVLNSGHQSEEFYSEFWTTILRGRVWHGRFLNRKKDGTLFDEEATISPVRDDMGEIVNFVAVKRDISQQVIMETALQEERSLLRQILSTIPYYVFWKDRDSQYLGCNQIFAESAGLQSPTDIIGLSDFDMPWGQSEAADYRADDAEVMRSGAPKLHILETQHLADGCTIHLDTSKVPLRDDAGNIFGVLGVYADVTEQKIMQAQLAQSQKLESIGQLAAGIAHEINTPTQYVGDNTRFLRDSIEDLLKAIDTYGSFVSSLEDEPTISCEVKDIIRTIDDLDLTFVREEIPNAIEQSLEGVSRVAQIVSAMKDFSHPGGVEKAPVDLNKAIQSTVTVCRNRWKYVADLDLDLGNLSMVPCVLGEFNQVMLNLIVNAADAIKDVLADSTSEKGRIIISTRQVDHYVEIRVEDTGGGVPDEIRQRIFDPFFTTKEVGSGTGQGLAISHDVIVNKHGGTIDLTTEPGSSSTFIIRLPVATADTDNVRDEA